MASNFFGNLFKIITFGESHGKGIGVVIDGCPAGIDLLEEDIHLELQKRSPGNSPYTSMRKEKDFPEILSGVFEGKTTGAPIAIFIKNQDVQSKSYDDRKNLYRPSHANFSYLHKYGIFDHRGGGRASARETVARVAAAAVAKKILAPLDIKFTTYLKQIGSLDHLVHGHEKMLSYVEEIRLKGDSIGGIVECVVENIPIGLGDPIYEKIEANLAKAMLSIPATKGFEIGSGFNCVNLKGTEHNDAYHKKEEKIKPLSNHAGGVLAGITTGEHLVFSVAFKPTSSIKIDQQTVDFEGKAKEYKGQDTKRHDPCVAIRAVPIVEAMCALVLVDSFLLNQCAKV